MLARSTLVFATILLACGEPPPPENPHALRDVQTPDNALLSEACTPSGAELCFDAIDNNCNGVLDEGCGLHTGILQFTIAWEDARADVDLVVTDAAGELVSVGATSRSGLIKDIECPGERPQCFAQPIENVYLSGGEPERGRYRVAVRLRKLGGASSPVSVRLGARVGQRTYAMKFELSPGESSGEKAFEFTL